MTTTKQVAALISAGSLLAVGTLAFAQTSSPTQADFDRCNRQAQAKVSGGTASPSASPSTSAPSVGSSPSPSAPSLPGSSSSSSAAKPSVDSAKPGGTMGSESASGSGSVPGSGGVSGPGGASGSASSTSDLSVRGMASAGLSDPAYQQAYRDCIQGK